MRPGRRLVTKSGRRYGVPVSRALPVLSVLSAVPVALLVAGCTGAGSSAGGTSTATTGGSAATATTATATSATVPSDPSAAWADRMCGEVVKITEAQNVAPPNLANTDTAQTVREFNQYLQANVDAVGRAITNLRGMGPSPITGTDQAMTALLNGLDSLRQSYEAVKDTLGTANVDDQQAAQAALLQAFTGISRGGEQLGLAINGLQSNQGLAQAAKQAPNCQKLNAGVVPTTTTS